MKIVYQILENNKIGLSKSVLDDYVLQSNEAFSTSAITGLINPIWNGTSFIEGATSEQIIEFNKIKIPQTISQMKLRLQLILSGVSVDSIYTMINQVPDLIQKELILTKWEYAVIMERTDPMLNQMAGLLNITQLQLDEIFINGNKL